MSYTEQQAIGWRNELIAAKRTIASQRHEIEKLRGERYSYAARERARIRLHLAGHFPAGGIEADRQLLENRPSCSCSADLGWHASVPDAVEAWLNHALGDGGAT